MWFMLPTPAEVGGYRMGSDQDLAGLGANRITPISRGLALLPSFISSSGAWPAKHARVRRQQDTILPKQKVARCDVLLHCHNRHPADSRHHCAQASSSPTNPSLQHRGIEHKRRNPTHPRPSTPSPPRVAGPPRSADYRIVVPTPITPTVPPSTSISTSTSVRRRRLASLAVGLLAIARGVGQVR